MLRSVIARLHVFTYLPSLAVWQKDHVMFDIELDVQMEGRFIKVYWNMWQFSVNFFGRDYFKCSAESWFNTWKSFVISFWVTIDSGSWTWHQQLKLQLNPPVCIALALYTCIQQMSVLTLALPGIFFVFFSPSNKISWIGQRLVGKNFLANSFLVLNNSIVEKQ